MTALNSTVRAYFKALSRSDFINLARYSAGPLHQLWTWSKDEWGMCACPSTHIGIQTLELTRFSPDEVEMSLGASSAGGILFTGPLLAVRTQYGWAVEDYFENGQDARRSVVTLMHTTQTRDAIQIRVVGLWMPDRTGDLWLIVSNRTGAPVKAIDLNVSGPWGTTPSARGLSPNVGMIQPRANVMTDMGWAPRGPVRAGQRYVLHLIFVNLSTAQRTQFDIPVRIPRTD